LILEPFLLAQWLFIKLIALCYFFAFFSLYRQVLGLYGSDGIMPIQDLMVKMDAGIKRHRFYLIPTIFWWRSDDKVLKGTALLGVLFSILVFFNLVPALFLFALLFLYLSFIVVGYPFLNFQWDVLLLEAGFLAVVMAVMAPPPTFAIYWAWFLTFRFLLASGIVKLQSGCKFWRSFQAMRHHFETQPLPNLGGYLAHLFLARYTYFITGVVYFFEIVVPLLLLGGEPLRFYGAVLSIFFQLLIIATGNYAFFNLLTIALCVTFFSNPSLEWLHSVYSPLQAFETNLFLIVLTTGISAFMLFLNVMMLIRQFKRFPYFERIYEKIAPFHCVNNYGLFAVMTTVRNEIILEGSDDGEEWKEFQFHYKPGALNQAPKQIAPLQPRLDWQMWFAALSMHPNDAWWYRFVAKIQKGERVVLDLIKFNPFPDKPPRHLRAHLYRYRFNTLSGLRESGNFWVRTFVGSYWVSE
jgi:hypothetical protein